MLEVGTQHRQAGLRPTVKLQEVAAGGVPGGEGTVAGGAQISAAAAVSRPAPVAAALAALSMAVLTHFFI